MRAIAVEPPLFQTSSFGDEIVLLRTHYELLGRQHQLYLATSAATVAPLTLVDRLNICDTADERAHDYGFRSTLGDLRLNGAVRLEPYPGGQLVGDAGRAILGHERFTVGTRPGRELVVILRTAPDVTATVMRAGGNGQMGLSFTEAGMVVSVSDQAVARLVFPPAPGWDERAFRVPASLVTGERTTITVSGRYASFYYWFFQ
jgi:hypothetical protein